MTWLWCWRLRRSLRRRRPGQCVASKSEKSKQLFDLALSRVVVRSMLAGQSLAYEDLLAAADVEIDVLLDERRERDAQLGRLAQEWIREARVQLAAVAESRAVSAADIEREFRNLDMALGPPLWHPENRENDL